MQGSGKTLAFALPIINFLVKEAISKADQAADGGCEQASRKALRALILCPTRELALQVSKDMSAVASALCVRVVALVGGISPQKQARLLSYKPPIVVATPGRLWDLMKSGAQHLVDLRYLNFLVLDEADRMVAQGHYEELTHILAHIPKSRREVCSSGEHGIQNEQGDDEGVVTSVGGAAGDEIRTSQQVLVGALRTYVFSATLALPEQLKARLQRGGSGSRGSRAGASLDSLMQRLSFRGKPKVCRCACMSCKPLPLTVCWARVVRSHAGQYAAVSHPLGTAGCTPTLLPCHLCPVATPHHILTAARVQIADLTTARKVADNVVEAFLPCVPDERDTMLYYLLCMHPGRTLVFLNAISGVRRVAGLLKALDVNVQVPFPRHVQCRRL